MLGSFGFQTPMKRTHVAIAALAGRELGDVHLLVAGEVSPTRLESLAREPASPTRARHRLPRRAALEAAIAAADLCLNLRYPTAGETSASLLRLLAVGRPAVVSDYAQFADLPATASSQVPVGDGEDRGDRRDRGARAARRTRSAWQRWAGRAREHVRREHDPARAAARSSPRATSWRAARREPAPACRRRLRR